MPAGSDCGWRRVHDVDRLYHHSQHAGKEEWKTTKRASKFGGGYGPLSGQSSRIEQEIQEHKAEQQKAAFNNSHEITDRTQSHREGMMDSKAVEPPLHYNSLPPLAPIPAALPRQHRVRVKLTTRIPPGILHLKISSSAMARCRTIGIWRPL